jgi:chemotaxis protein histidine kinase CheA
VGGFLIEAEEHLQFIGAHIREVDRAADRQETLREIRRSVHTIKGAAAMVALPVISQLAHRMEDLLDQLWDQVTEFTPACHQLLIATYDALSDLVQAGGKGGGLEGRLAALYADYETILVAEESPASAEAAAAPAAGESETAAEAPQPELTPESAGFVRVPMERLDELMRLVSELFVERSVFELNLGELTGELRRYRSSGCTG